MYMYMYIYCYPRLCPICHPSRSRQHPPRTRHNCMDMGEEMGMSACIYIYMLFVLPPPSPPLSHPTQPEDELSISEFTSDHVQ